MPFVLQIIEILLLVTLAVFVFYFDIKYRIIPNFLTYTAMGVFFILSLLSGHELWIILVTVGITGLFFCIFNMASGNKIGWGDIKLLIAVACNLTPLALYASLVMACFLALGFMVFVMVVQHQKINGYKIPFGPFIVLGWILAWIADGTGLLLNIVQFIKPC